MNLAVGTLARAAQTRPFEVDNIPEVIESIGGRDRGRTGDLIVANDALSQLSYSPTSSDSKFNKGYDSFQYAKGNHVF